MYSYRTNRLSDESRFEHHCSNSIGDNENNECKGLAARIVTNCHIDAEVSYLWYTV